MGRKLILAVKWVVLGIASYVFVPLIIMKVASIASSFAPPEFIMELFKSDDYERRTIFLLMDVPTRVFPLAIIFICISALIGRFFHFMATLLVIIPAVFWSYVFASLNFKGDVKDYLYYLPELISLSAIPLLVGYLVFKRCKQKSQTIKGVA